MHGVLVCACMKGVACKTVCVCELLLMRLFNIPDSKLRFMNLLSEESHESSYCLCRRFWTFLV